VACWLLRAISAQMGVKISVVPCPGMIMPKYPVEGRAVWLRYVPEPGRRSRKPDAFKSRKARETVGREIPKTTTILHWDYWSYGHKIPDVLQSLRLFRSQGHQVGFIPTSGWSLDKCGPDYGQQVVEQIRAVRADGVTDLMYFVGAIWHEPSLRATSWALHGGGG
jgi:hypothetical protein